MAAPAPSSTPFREQLVVPPLGWVGALGAALVAAAEVHGGADGTRAWLPYALLVPLALLVLVWLSRERIAIADGVLHVPGARAPLGAFGPVEVLDREQLRRWLGPQGDPAAWVRVRPWHRAAVRLPVSDPEDETPYWLVGTRRPSELAAAVRG